MKRIRMDDLIAAIYELEVSTRSLRQALLAIRALNAAQVVNEQVSPPPNNPPTGRGFPLKGETTPPAGQEEDGKKEHPDSINSPRYEALSRRFLQEQHRNWPTLVPATPSATKIRAGAEAVRLLCERDGFPLPLIGKVARWAAADEFWSRNLLSLSSLRHKGRNGETKYINIAASMTREGPATSHMLEITPMMRLLEGVLHIPSTAVHSDHREYKCARIVEEALVAAWHIAPEDERLSAPPWVRKGLRSAFPTPPALAGALAEWVKRAAPWALTDGISQRPSWVRLARTWDRVWAGFTAEQERAGVRVR